MKQTAWDKEMEKEGSKDAEWIFGGNLFMRYRDELENFLCEKCDPYEERVFRFLFRKSYKNGGRGDALFYTIDMKRISEGTGISEIHLKKNVIKGLEEKGLIKRFKEKGRRTYTYVLSTPKELSIQDTP